MVNLNVRLDENEHQKLVNACNGLGCDKSTLVRDALRAYLGAQTTSPEILSTRPESAPSRLRNIRSALDEQLANSTNYEIPKLTTRKVRYDNGVVDIFDENGKLKQRNIPKQDGSYMVRLFC